MDETITRIVSELQDLRHLENPTTAAVTLSDSFLSDLQSLFDENDTARFSDSLAANSLSLSSLVKPISAAMVSGPAHLAASRLYLSLLLLPDSPVCSLFSPMPFFSILHSLRRSLKPQRRHVDPSSSAASPKKRKTAKPKPKGRNNCESKEGELDVRVLFSVLEKLESVMDLIHLDRFPDCLKSLIQTVAEIPAMGIDVCGNAGSFNRLTDLCARVLVKVFEPENLDHTAIAAEVFRSLAPMILQHKSQVRVFALGFVGNEMMDVARRLDGVKKASVNFVWYLVHKAPDKSEGRALAVESIMEIVRVMEVEERVGFGEYVVKMTQGKPKLRLLAVDLILAMVMSLRDVMGLDSESGARDSLGRRCLEALIQRCSDAMAGIRARALSNLSQVVGFLSGDDRSKGVLKEVMGFGDDVTMGEMQEGWMNEILRARCMDEKAAVRKAALLLVTKLMAVLGSGFDRALIKTMGMACSDPLVSIRKAAISAISVAFRTFLDDSVAIEWLHSVPALISDHESSIQEECENLFVELVLERVSAIGSEINTGAVLPEGELGLLKEICNVEVAPWVKKICTNLGKKNRLKHKYATALQSIIKISESLWLRQSLPIEKWTAPPGSWFLLSELSAYLAKAVDWEFLCHHWQLFDKHGVGKENQSPLPEEHAHEEGGGMESSSISWAGDRVFLLQTISNVSVELPSEVSADLAHDLLRRIENFNMHSTEVNAHVKALRTLCKRKVSDPDAADELVKRCVHKIASKASKILDNYISKESATGLKGGFFTPPKRGSTGGKRTVTISKSLSRVVTAVYTIGSVVIICPSADMRSIIDLLNTIITSGNSDLKGNKLASATISLKQTAPSLYIQAWLTLGKICLTDEKTAKKYIPLFVQELEKSDSAALRNNLVVVMADFCIRHTSLVDSYIPRITKCLCDPCELVRRQTFILLSRLLQRDYVKWRGVLFLRFLLSLVDESEKIKQLANFLFGNILKVKAPLLGYNSFVEAIFVLNDCRAHKGHAGGHRSQESRLFSIRGKDETSRSRRMHIYVTLLKQMAPEHLLQTFVKLCTEILAAASDGMLNLDDVTGQSVLQDAFQIIACKEIRLPSNRGLSSDAGDIDEEGADNGGAAAKGRAITQALKKGLIQSTIPIFIELKRLLESRNSPLIGSLMECLRIILKDYKNEIEDILVADKQLQKELIYDMQKYEKAKTKSTAAETVATHKKTVSFHSPGISKIASVRQAYNKSISRLQGDVKLASAMGDVAAEAIARSVLKEMNKGRQTPPLSALSMPKVKTCDGGQTSRSCVPLNVLESVSRRQNFDFVEEN